MKNIKEYLSNINEAVDMDKVSDLKTLLSREDMIIGKNVAALNPKVIKRAAGYMVEAAVKSFIEMDSKFKGKVYEDTDEWCDFTYEGQKFEIKSFVKGRKYSNTKLTENQVEHKDDLIFVLCEYDINGTEVIITKIDLVPGNELKISGNRMVKN